ncbi:MAG: hemerythrin domain-containing protein [Burkholderiales bacterium]|nr:MAG: hemerythrin domain-containing protein [Burkholderiales bacterium]
MYRKALEVIKSEHRTLAAVLHAMQHLVNEIRSGRIEPNFELFAAILRYIDAFPEKLHHPKEDEYLYRRMRERSHDADAVLDRLQREHVEGVRLIRALEHALVRYQAGGDQAFPDFARRVDEYVEFNWKHMRTEEDQAMPAALAVLGDEDWAEIDDAFGRNGDPLFGMENTRELDELFRRIVHLAPPPIGLGSEAPRR